MAHVSQKSVLSVTPLRQRLAKDSMMMTLYLLALAFGGTLLAVSLLFGGDSAVDVDVDVDADIDVDADADADAATGGSLSAVDAWLPIASVRFWTFFLAFFGFAGVVLTWSGSLANPVGIAILSTGFGYACGASITRAVRHLRQHVVDSSVHPSDYIGSTATVLLPIAANKPGTVRTHIRGRFVDLVAECEERIPLVKGESVLIYAIKEDGRVFVSRAGSEPA